MLAPIETGETPTQRRLMCNVDDHSRQLKAPGHQCVPKHKIVEARSGSMLHEKYSMPCRKMGPLEHWLICLKR